MNGTPWEYVNALDLLNKKYCDCVLLFTQEDLSCYIPIAFFFVYKIVKPISILFGTLRILISDVIT